MIGPDKEVKMLKKSRLMQVSEFNTMVNSLQRFKEDLAVRALTGKKNIRSQKTQDRVFFSVLEKMLMEVADGSSSYNASTDAAEQQLQALKKVYMWFQSNRGVLVRSDGYFPSARKITEEIHGKIARKKVAAGKRRTVTAASATPLKTIDRHLKELQALQEEIASSRNLESGSSMFAPSPTQDLTSVDSATIRDKGFYQEDMDLAREFVEHEYFSGNKIERINRPMTAPPRLKKLLKASGDMTDARDMTLQYGLKPVTSARPQSAINDVKHELSWAKVSPTPLVQLINKQEKGKKGPNQMIKKIEITIPSEHGSAPPASPEVITDPDRIAKLVMFKEYCVQHAAQQEGYMRQYVNHKHGTRQHFFEFPENSTETAVRKTARKLHNRHPHRTFGIKQSEMTEYRDLSLEEFLNKDTPTTEAKEGASDPSDNMNSARSNSAPARLTLTNGEPSKRNVGIPKSSPEKMRVVQPRQENVTVSSVFDLADFTGKRMNTIKEKVLSAPQHGWRYPMIPMASGDAELPKAASGMVLALHDGDKIQHKVLIPLSAAERAKSVEPLASIGAKTDDFDLLDEIQSRYNTPRTIPSRPKSAKSVASDGSRPLTRPQSSPRYFTGVTAVYRQYKSGVRGPPDDSPADVDYYYDAYEAHGLRSAGTARGPSRPRTAASWGSYPAQHSEVSKSVGAASHHSTGTLRHRSVAETMRVRSVAKVRNRSAGSGRSSASSYVAQLRAKQRAGGNLPVRPAGGPRKRKTEAGFRVPPSESTAVMPQLSFVSIVAPMHVPADLSATTYAPPGGVYCGTTAAVAKATDAKEAGVDDFDFEEGLSLEDYHSVPKDEDAEEQSEKEQDNWLSQWLSGGPLEGLQKGDGPQGGAATYADLVSRAAILDSSDERSYSDEQQSSTGAAALRVATPDPLDFALSPRSDEAKPDFLVGGHQATDAMLPVSGPNSEPNIGSSSSGQLTMDEVSPRSSLSSAATRESSSSGRDDADTREEDGLEAMDETRDQVEEADDEKDGVSESDGGTATEESEEVEEEEEDEKMSSQDSGKGSDEHNDPGEIKEDILDFGKTVFLKEELLTGIQGTVRDVVHQLISSVDVADCSKSAERSDETEKSTVAALKTIKEADVSLPDKTADGEVQLEAGIISDESTVQSGQSTPASVEENEERRTFPAEENEEETGSERPASGSDVACSESSFESDREILYDATVPIRIVITPARKVERQLRKDRDSAKVERTEEKMTEPSIGPKKDPEVADSGTPSAKDETEGNTDPQVTETSDDPVASSEVGVDSRIITKEEIAAVTSLSRPASGRPIPDEKEVRDPFVDMVASTRQKQIQRGVDVQAIFSASAQGGEATKTTAADSQETEAVLKMQRAYRRHLSRTRAARKCQRMSRETLEWARSYKALLKEKSDRRKQRLQESRNSLRTAERREMQRISRVGPHNVVYEVFHPEPELPDSELIQDSAVEIQRQVRGWLLRGKLHRVREKVSQMGLSGMSSAVEEYRKILRKTQERHGNLQPSLFLTFEELDSYLDQKKKFELMFKKREFWNEMESSEMPAFFNDCGLFPSCEEINDAWDSVRKSRDINRERKKMKSKTAMTLDDVLEVAFYIYVPAGARMDPRQTRSSTWLNPVVGGKEGLKLRENNDEDQVVEEADFAEVGKLVARSYKDRNDAADQ